MKYLLLALLLTAPAFADDYNDGYNSSSATIGTGSLEYQQGIEDSMDDEEQEYAQSMAESVSGNE